MSLKCNRYFYLISGTLADISREAVGRLLRRAKKRDSSGKEKHYNNLSQHDSIGMVGPVNFYVSTSSRSIIILCHMELWPSECA